MFVPGKGQFLFQTKILLQKKKRKKRTEKEEKTTVCSDLSEKKQSSVFLFQINNIEYDKELQKYDTL